MINPGDEQVRAYVMPGSPPSWAAMDLHPRGWMIIPSGLTLPWRTSPMPWIKPPNPARTPQIDATALAALTLVDVFVLILTIF